MCGTLQILLGKDTSQIAGGYAEHIHYTHVSYECALEEKHESNRNHLQGLPFSESP